MKIKYVICVIYVLSLVELKSQCNHPDDIAGLTAIYNAMDGANWIDQTWDINCTTCDACSWTGVFDQNNDGRVDKLILSTSIGMDLNGTIHSSISMLSELEIFEISDFNNTSNVSGVIPNSISFLNNLQSFRIEGVGVSGTIPDIFGNKPNLHYVYIRSTELSGAIEETVILNMANNNSIKLLILDYNLFNGILPNSISQLSTLEKLLLNNNNLTGILPNDFGIFPNLNQLYLHDNNFEGCFPYNLSTICGNAVVSTYGNNFDVNWLDFCNLGLGTCCEITTHPDYAALETFYNDLNGDNWTNNSGWLDNCDPCNGWFGVTCNANNRVIEINLANNNLSGTLPPNLNGLDQLQELIVNNNQIGGELPPDYGSLPNLTHFTAAYNNFEGGIPPEYCSFAGQTSFDFSNNSLSDCYDPALACLCSLPSIDLETSNGNNFNVPFSAFCTTGDGDCSENCIDFDGVDDFLYIQNLSTPTDFTLMSWFRADITSNGLAEDRILSFGPNQRLEIGIEQTGPGNGKLWIHDQSYFTGSFGPFVRDGVWHHVAFSRQGLTSNIYLDGLLTYSYTTTSHPNIAYGPNFRVGNWTGGGNLSFFSGRTDDVAIFNVALGSSDIMNLQTCELSGSENNLVAFYDFNIGISGANNLSIGSIPDKTGNGNDLIVSNLTMDGNTSNLVTSTTGVNANCNLCLTPPTAICKSGLSFLLSPISNEVTVLTSDVDNGSNSNCGSLTYSFHPTNAVSSMTYQCITDIGHHLITLYVTDINGVKSSCTTSIDIQHPNPEINALKEFADSANYLNWTNTQNGINPWFANCDPCGKIPGNVPWFGLTCTMAGQVSIIYMTNNNLIGTLPPSLNVFPYLNWFNVNGNSDPNILNLSGNLPDVCGLDLLYFSVGNNQFTGQISSCFETMSQLVGFNVSNNSLTGPIPNFGSHQPNLADIRFHGNSFTGQIPATFGSIPSLNYITLNNNDLSGCYSQQLIGLCNNPNLTLSNSLISNGNAGLTPWVDFCNTSVNACCPSPLIIDWTLLFDATYKSSGNIILNTNVPANSNITFSHGTNSQLVLSPQSTINNQGNIIVINNGCY